MELTEQSTQVHCPEHFAIDGSNITNLITTSDFCLLTGKPTNDLQVMESQTQRQIIIPTSQEQLILLLLSPIDFNTVTINNLDYSDIFKHTLTLFQVHMLT